MRVPGSLALTLACVGLAVTLPAKLDQVAARAQGYNLQPPQQSGYNYEPPQQPANLYELGSRSSSRLRESLMASILIPPPTPDAHETQTSNLQRSPVVTLFCKRLARPGPTQAAQGPSHDKIQRPGRPASRQKCPTASVFTDGPCRGIRETPSRKVAEVRSLKSTLKLHESPFSLPQPAPTPAAPAMMAGMPYDFGWGVDDPDSGNQFSQKEESDGNVVRGEYRVLLPDGRLQIVRYFDDGSGFNVDITYE
ncbi:uncharacterized protein LOC134765828 [Penaeus indicus]|uniref:uncharacterized protein LOC134765828 n=1 Tax=Penaeus indicus TaxID=29960 RepID=UPI00300D0DDC